MKKLVILHILTFVLIFIDVSNLQAQRKIIIKTSQSELWSYANLNDNGVIHKVKEITDINSVKIKSKSVKVSVVALNNRIFDTVINYHFWQKRKKINLDNVCYFENVDTMSLVKRFLCDTSKYLYIYFYSIRQTCTDETTTETIVLYHNKGKIYGSFVQKDYARIKQKEIRNDLFTQIDSLEISGFNNNVDCLGGFFGEHCGKYIFLLDSKAKVFTNNLDEYEGFIKIRELFRELE